MEQTDQQMGAIVPIDGAFAVTLLEASPDCLKLVNFDGIVEYINQSGVEVMGFSGSNDAVGQQWETMGNHVAGSRMAKN